MNGFLFDENLPANLRFTPAFPVIHVSVLGESPSDTQIWQYAKQNDLAIVTKDADFSESPTPTYHSPFFCLKSDIIVRAAD